MDGFIKLHRKFTEWEWYDDMPTLKVFIHMLFRANFKDTKWRGIDVKRGQFITSIGGLASETKLTEQNIRTVLKNLKKTGEITCKVTNKYTVVTVLKYGDYQDIEQTTNKQTNKQLTNNQQTTNKQLTTGEEREEGKEGKERKNNTARVKKTKYAEYVTMTNDEHSKLLATYGETATARMIDTLDNYKGSSGKKYASDYRTILSWVVERIGAKPIGGQNKPNDNDPWSKMGVTV